MEGEPQWWPGMTRMHLEVMTMTYELQRIKESVLKERIENTRKEEDLLGQLKMQITGHHPVLPLPGGNGGAVDGGAAE